MEPRDALAVSLRRLRHERGLTQERLADQAGLHLTDIARMETGRREPGLGVLMRLAQGLEISLRDLAEALEDASQSDGPPASD